MINWIILGIVAILCMFSVKAMRKRHKNGCCCGCGECSCSCKEKLKETVLDSESSKN